MDLIIVNPVGIDDAKKLLSNDFASLDVRDVIFRPKTGCVGWRCRRVPSSMFSESIERRKFRTTWPRYGYVVASRYKSALLGVFYWKRELLQST